MKAIRTRGRGHGSKQPLSEPLARRFDAPLAAPTQPECIRRVTTAAMLVRIERKCAPHPVVGNRGHVEGHGTRLLMPDPSRRCGMDDGHHSIRSLLTMHHIDTRHEQI
jgi:hypothetical protein